MMILEHAPPEDDGTTPAPPGFVYVCPHCGKTSRTRWGFDAENKRCADAGWDESCAMRCALCHELARVAGGYLPVRRWEAVRSMHLLDKSTWGPGQWEGEPDFVEWTEP